MATDFSQKRAEEILKPEKLAEYRAKMSVFHKRLSDLHLNLYFVEKVIDFPHDLFTSHIHDAFLRIVMDNFLQAAILQVNKLASKKDGESQTLRQFANFMSDQAIANAFRDDYRRYLKQVRFNPHIERLLETIKGIRDQQVAHWDENPEQVSLTFNDLKAVVRDTTKLFEAAAFDVGYHYLGLAYDPAVRQPRGVDPRTDIERILDSIARESHVLHEPEEHPDAWPHLTIEWSPQMRERFNRWRRRCRLPEV